MSAQLEKTIDMAAKAFYQETVVLKDFGKFNNKTLVLNVKKNSGIDNGLVTLAAVTKEKFKAAQDCFIANQLHLTIFKNAEPVLFKSYGANFLHFNTMHHLS